MKRLTLRYLTAGILTVISTLNLTPNAHADVIISVNNSGGNVVATGSGTLNTSGISPTTGQVPTDAGTNPRFGFLTVGSTTFTNWRTISGPTSFGSGSFRRANSFSGDVIGLGGMGTLLLAPTNYASGTALSGSATWDNTTLQGLGLDEGSYTWTWGSNANADSLTINIGNVSAVPEPSSAGLLGLVGTAIAFRRRRSKPNSSSGRQ